MTNEERAILEYYQELNNIDKDNIRLVRDIRNGKLYVKKDMELYLYKVYMQLKESDIKGVPGIVECIIDDDKLIVIEEYISGKSLKEIMSTTNTLDVDMVELIAKKLANVLISLQELNPPIIHRDIKPSNIIIQPAGEVYLIDFSAARNMDEDESEDTRLLGTQYFAAPEQYGFGQSDLRTDVYGFGATINYLLTRAKPKETIAQCRLTPVLKKSLMVDPKDRYRNARELKMALDGELTNISFVTRIVQKLAIAHMHNQEEREKINASNRKYLPPGCRRGNKLCIALTCLYAIMSLLVACKSTIENDDGSLKTNPELMLYRVYVFLVLLVTYLWFGNYLDPWHKFPLMRGNRIIRYIMIVAYYGLFLAILVLSLSMLLSII